VPLNIDPPVRHLDQYRISYPYTLHLYSLAQVCNCIPSHTSAARCRHTRPYRILCCHNTMLALQLVLVWMWFLNDLAVNSKIIRTCSILTRDFQGDKFPTLKLLWGKSLVKLFNHFSSRLSHCCLNLVLDWSEIISISTA
jgi:hypothetical protein